MLVRDSGKGGKSLNYFSFCVLEVRRPWLLPHILHFPACVHTRDYHVCERALGSVGAASPWVGVCLHSVHSVLRTKAATLSLAMWPATAVMLVSEDVTLDLFLTVCPLVE